MSSLLFPVLMSIVAADEPKADPKVAAPTGAGIVAADARLEKVYTRTQKNITGGLTEGAAVAPDGSIYFTDIPFGPKDKGLILRFDPRTRKTTVFTDDSKKANGLMFDAKGYLIACEGADGGGRCVSRWNIKTRTRTVVADNYNERKFNSPNDLCIDLKGRIYFSDPRYVGSEKRELRHQAVYRIDRDGTVNEVTHDVETPNGIAISPDQKTLYLADHNPGSDDIINRKPEKKGSMKIYAFPLGDDGLVSGKRKTIVDFGTEDGCDGMTVDAKGNIYLTVRSAKRPGVLAVNPEGKEIAFIPTGPANQTAKNPVGFPSNCDFGIGDESSVLYITVDQSLYRIRLLVEGWHIPWEK